MKCPSCKVTLTNLKSELWVQIERDNLTGAKTCPDCHRKMHVVRGDERTGGIELDVCSNCMFFWFDSEEVGKFPRVSDEEVERRNTDALLKQTQNLGEMEKLEGVFDQTNVKSSRAERMAQETTAGALTSILGGVAVLYLDSDEE